MPTLGVVISGRVQGVGFRAFVRAEANSRGILGEVWNRGDGCVEAVVTHESLVELGEFVQTLKRGPGTVQKVSAMPLPEQAFADFRIVRSVA